MYDTKYGCNFPWKSGSMTQYVWHKKGDLKNQSLFWSTPAMLLVTTQHTIVYQMKVHWSLNGIKKSAACWEVELHWREAEPPPVKDTSVWCVASYCFDCRCFFITLFYSILWGSKYRAQLSNLWWMPNSVSKGLALPWKQAHQDDSKDTPQPICECQVSFPLLRIRINQDNP